MSKEYRLMSLPELGKVIAACARSRKLTVTALVTATGSPNSSLVGLATGSSTNKDANVGPVLQLLASGGWEVVVRPADGNGVIISRPGALPLRVVAAGEDPLEIPIHKITDLATMLNTLALANDRTVNGLVGEANVSSSVLVSLATGRDVGKDYRFGNMWTVIGHAGFVMFARDRHVSARAARRAEFARLSQ